MIGSARVYGVIPARLESTRLPRKVLREIAGKPMLQWVYENARRSGLLDELVIATDSDEVVQVCKTQGIPVMMTGRHPSGTDRVHEVMQRTQAEIYVNIQGDEPTVQPKHIELLLLPFERREVQVTTLKVAIDQAAAGAPDNVKVVDGNDGRALYFSRWAIPYDRDRSGSIRYFKHLGLYAYTRSALEVFHSLPPSVLEKAEKLEQLRFLQNGVDIHVIETSQDTIGVDTERDLRRVVELFSK